MDDDALRRAHAHVFDQVSRSSGIAGAIGFLPQQELTVDDANLAVGLQMELGPAPTTYLETAHVGKFWMRDRFLPAIADIDPYDEWVKRGRPDIVSEARAKVEEIRARHTPLPLERDQPQAIEDVLNEARQHCRHSGLISDEETSANSARQSGSPVRAVLIHTLRSSSEAGPGGEQSPLAADLR